MCQMVPRPLRLVLLLSVAAVPALRADAIVITQAMTASTIAEVFIERDGIRVELEIGGRDLPGFRHLMPDGVWERMGFEPEPLAKRLGRFFREDMAIRTDGGPPLPGRVQELGLRKRVVRDVINGQPVPQPEGEGEDVVFAVLEYAFRGRPDTLTLSSPGTESGAPAATIGFVAYHVTLPINDFRYLSAEETLDLDWSDPWYSRFRNRNLWRQYNSPMNAFLYIEPFEVRTEIIVRPVDMEAWLDLGLDDLETIPVDMQYDLQMKIAEFLAEHQDLRIDGEPVQPELDRVNFLRRTLRTSTVISPPEELDKFSATLGVIFVAPTEGLPQEASITWDLFNERIQRIPAASTDEAGPLRTFLMPDDNVLLWKNFLKNPTLPTLVTIAPPPGLPVRIAGVAGWLFAGLLVVGVVMQVKRGKKEQTTAGRRWGALATLLILAAASFAVSLPQRMTDKRAGEVVSSLLHNIYRSFDFRGEEAIYDVLDHSVSGDLLTQIYLETRRGLELASQGGACAKVKEIEMLSVEPHELSGEPGFSARCVWNVAGSVGHWGHVHTRTNQYEADLTIQPIDGRWKLTGLEVLQEERL